jgi:trans-aconitate 2-methyltransferase
MTSDASPWKPEQYEKFRDERSAPFFDLLELVRPCPGGRVLDLGCGTGELTRALHAKTQAAETLGIDSSETMLARSGPFAGSGLRFERAEIESFAPEKPFDVVFSNAALQWVNGHEELFRQISSHVADGGQFAVQVPANDDHPSHVTAHRLAAEEPFRSALGGYVRDWPVREPELYAALLDRLGYREQHVRLQVYGHHLESADGVVEWVKGTLLTDYEKRMSPELWAEYMRRYREQLLPQLAIHDSQFTIHDSSRGGGAYFYAFKRILMWGQR